MTHQVQPLGTEQRFQAYNHQEQSRWYNPFDSFAVVGPCLQYPSHFIEEITQNVALGYKAWALFCSSVIFLMIYGAVLGSGIPLLSLSTALAVPFVFLGSLLICLPVIYLLDVLTGSLRTFGQVLVILLNALMAWSAVCVCFAPIILMFSVTGTIEQFFVINVGVIALASIIGLIYLAQGIINTATVDSKHRLVHVNEKLHFGWMLLYLMVVCQLSWSMLSLFRQTGALWGYIL